MRRDDDSWLEALQEDLREAGARGPGRRSIQAAPGAAVEAVVTWPWVRAKKRLALLWCREQVQDRAGAQLLPVGSSLGTGSRSEAESECDRFPLIRPGEPCRVGCALTRWMLKAVAFWAAKPKPKPTAGAGNRPRGRRPAGRAASSACCRRAAPLRSAPSSAAPLWQRSRSCMSQFCAEPRHNGGRCYFGITGI